MAASQQPSDRIMPPDTIEPVNGNFDVEEKPTDQDNLKEQPLPAKDERIVPPNPSQDITSTGPSRDAMGQSGSFSVVGDHSAMYPPNIYAPQPQPFYYGGEWDEYPQYVNPEGLEIGSSGIYNDNPSLVFHTGYGYNSQMPYGPYSPVTTPLPSVRGDGQLYSAQQYPFSAPPYYQQQVPLSMPYITPEAPVSQTETIMALNSDQQGDAMLFGPRPGYPPPFGSFGRGNFGGSGSHIFHDSQGFVSAPPWSDWSKPSDGRSSTPLSSPAASPQPVGMPGSFGHNIGMISQQQRPSYGFGSGSGSYARGFPRSGAYQGSTLGNKSFPRSEANVWSTTATDKGRLQGRGNGYFCSSSGTPDVLSEQTRGPRAFKQKTQTTTGHDSSVDDKKNSSTSTAESCSGSFNSPYFTTEYNDGMFFIIKSYSEDNVHRSIKYGVWASTPNGNRKLDAAYHEAQEREGNCPVFLFFSVNASAQFCGVAEMVGPVDFDKSVDYWQQDKWSGQFPVKWHIIKDVPNSQFRHIILENNDNKPVTNSRDTQEVKLEQGVEMLKILKDHERDTSILDDFDFYEEREKAMQGRKAKQQATLIGGDENRDSAALSSNHVKHLSKTFAQAVRLEGSSSNSKENIGLEKAGSSPDSSDDSKVESVKSS